MVLFGSQATSLSLPGSDVDLVVLDVAAPEIQPALGFSKQDISVVAAKLKKLFRKLSHAGLIAQGNVISKAKVQRHI